MQPYLVITFLKRNNSNNIFFFQQTAKTVYCLYIDIAAFDMNYEEVKEFCKGTPKNKFSYLKTNTLDDEGRFCIPNENKNDQKVFNPLTELF